ncbi:MAG: cobalt ECF transporter T component CbiQ [Planctomycetes bacterium]|nr:cobalt ECF transporter T component CbiQ [Planctomycetota bacterium]
MQRITFFQGESVIHRIDPRARVVVAAVYAVLVAMAVRLDVLGVALGVAAATVAAARLPWRDVLGRLIPLNVFMLLLLVTLPLTSGGEPLFSVGPVGVSRQGLRLAATIAIKGNAIVLALVALLATVEVTALGHALSHLRVPDKLTWLLLFSVRYIDVIHREYRRMAAAMKVRGFRPRANLHTYRTYGHLVGMLLVRSFDRADRVLAAMKCRGFQGRFYVLDHFHFSRRDAAFTLTAGVVLLLMAVAEWTPWA